MGVFDEISDPRRRELISQIAARVDHHDLVEPGFWAFVWLADVVQLEGFTRDFVKLDSNISRKCVYTSPVWTKALKTCETTCTTLDAQHSNIYASRGEHPRPRGKSFHSRRRWRDDRRGRIDSNIDLWTVAEKTIVSGKRRESMPAESRG